MPSADPLSCALRLLQARSRSEAELAAALRRRGFAAEKVETTISRCRELGYLDDVRFARTRADYLLREGRAVGSRLEADLRARGIEAKTAREAAAAAQEEHAAETVLKSTLERRFPGFALATTDDRQRRRVVNYFLRRGFPLPMILTILNGREAD